MVGRRIVRSEMLFLLSAFFIVSAVHADPIKLTETYIDFQNSTGLFNQTCNSQLQIFERKPFANSSFPTPEVHSDYFLTSSKYACIQTPLLTTTAEVAVVVHLYRKGLFQYANTLDVLYLNENDDVLKNSTLTFEKTYDWVDDILGFVPTKPFRVRLEYTAPTLGYLLSISSITFNISGETLPDDECYRDDFSENSPNLIFSPCSNANFNNFTIMQYSETKLVEKPLGANDYFLTLSENKKSACMRSPTNLNLNEGTEIIFSIFTENNSGKISRAFLFAFDASDDAIALNMLPIEIDDSRKWRTVSMIMNEPAKIILQLQVEDLSNSSAIFAIDYVGIKDKYAEDCTTTCQCQISKSNIENIEQFTSVENQPVESFGSAAIIVSTTVVVSILWGGVIIAFVYRHKKKSNNEIVN